MCVCVICGCQHLRNTNSKKKIRFGKIFHHPFPKILFSISLSFFLLFLTTNSCFILSVRLHEQRENSFIFFPLRRSMSAAPCHHVLFHSAEKERNWNWTKERIKEWKERRKGENKKKEKWMKRARQRRKKGRKSLINLLGETLEGIEVFSHF